MARLTTRQLKQLLEIDHSGPGIRAEVQELITRLTSGGVGVKTGDLLTTQAKCLWDKGFGRELGIGKFADYLATIPEIPQALLADDDRFPELILVDARHSIVKICELLGIDYSGNNQTFEDFDLKQTRTEKVYWARLQDGKKNRNKSVQTCRKTFAADELGLTVNEGLALFAQDPDCFRGFSLDISGSVHRDDRGCAACLDWFDVRPRLGWNVDDSADPGFGTGSRRE